MNNGKHARKSKRGRIITVLSLAAMIGLAVSSLKSLPMFRALYDQHAGYRTNCSVCHRPKDNRLTSYAREFRRLGGGTASLRTLDVMDPDEDGFSSKSERFDRSNPGDRRSTPEHPGSWLSGESAVPPPGKALSKVFGFGVGVGVLEKRLTEAHIREAEMTLGEKLREEEHFPVVFDIGEFRAAYAYYGDSTYSVFLVIVGAKGVIRAVEPVSLKGDRRLGGESYLKQFRGKTIDGLSAVSSPLDAEAENAQLLKAVRRTMKILELTEGP